MLLQNGGFESGNQTCTVALIGKLVEEGKIEIPARFIDYFMYEGEESVIAMREKFTYGTKTLVDAEKIKMLVEDCK
jgi:hypothetical protein